MADGYELKDGDIIFPDGKVSEAPTRTKPHRVDPAILVEKLKAQIPDGCSTQDVLQSFLILLGFVVMQSGRSKQERVSVAYDIHEKLLKNLEFEHRMADRVVAIQERYKAEGRELTNEEFNNLIRKEMKEVAEEVASASKTPRMATESGLQ